MPKKNKKARREARKKKKKAKQGPPVDISGWDWLGEFEDFLNELPLKKRMEVLQYAFDQAEIEEKKLKSKN